MSRNSTKQIAIIAYLCIILKGQMIGLPFGLWLLFALFDFGSVDEMLALLAVAGLVIIYLNWHKGTIPQILTIDFLCFLMLCIPLIGRLAAVPIEMFNYLAFIIPVALFLLLYPVSLIFGLVQNRRN